MGLSPRARGAASMTWNLTNDKQLFLQLPDKPDTTYPQATKINLQGSDNGAPAHSVPCNNPRRITSRTQVLITHPILQVHQQSRRRRTG